MYKTILALIGLIFIGLLFFTQTKEKIIKVSPTITQRQKQKQTETIAKPIEHKENKSAPTLKPFKPLLKPMTASAAGNEENEIPLQSLEELHLEAFKTIQPKINEAMLKLPDCLESAATKAEAFGCNKQLRELHKELAISMGDFSEDNITGYDDTFVWDEKTKTEMIREIENSTQERQEMQNCIEASSTAEELEQCFAMPNETNKEI